MAVATPLLSTQSSHSASFSPHSQSHSSNNITIWSEKPFFLLIRKHTSQAYTCGRMMHFILHSLCFCVWFFKVNATHARKSLLFQTPSMFSLLLKGCWKNVIMWWSLLYILGYFLHLWNPIYTEKSSGCEKLWMLFYQHWKSCLKKHI